jgi:predicted O-linked N-acetylglucosamine transferase (SPINDLY family)
MQLTVQNAFALAARHEAAGRPGEARAIYDEILSSLPEHPGALLKIAEQELATGEHESARRHLERALAAAREQSLPIYEICLVLARLHLARGDRSASASAIDAALAARPENAALLARLGAVALDAAAFPVAERCYRAARTRGSVDSAPAAGLALALIGQHRLEEAQASARRGLEDHPGDIRLLHALGNALKSSGAAADACEVLEDCALRAPDDASVRVSLGGACLDAGFAGRAREHLERAIALGATGGEVWDNLGLAHRMLKDDEAALHAFERAVEVDPALTPARANLVHTRHFLCEWDGLDDCERQLAATLDDPASDARWSPFVALAMPISPAQQLAVARRWSRAMLPTPVARRPALPRDGRLRIGYLSASFHEHPTARLMVGLFEEHDRGRFEITGYSYGPDDRSPLRARLRAAFDHWRDVRGTPDAEVARLIGEDGIDLLVDRAGHTLGGRLAILAARPAPVQVHYMSFPGTIGYDAVDGIIADAEVVPPGGETFYQERVWRLPRCYYVNDRRRGLPAPARRADHGLPEGARVLACLNQTYKLRRVLFSAWMDALHAAPDAVLWLLVNQARARANLRAEAERARIDPERLVFALSLPQEEHIARLRCADLALDTLPYGSHTSGVDALWAGVPMLTCRGATFAGRVGASLLLASGLPDLIADSSEAYATRLLDLVQKPARLAEYRDFLERTRNQNPLFDTPGFARDWEALLVRIYDDAIDRN